MTTSMPSKDALCALVAELHARGLHDLAQGLMAAIDTLYPAKPTPAPLPCPFCGGNATTGEHWTECEVCDTSWPNLYSNRRAPCPECARLTALCASQNDTNRDALVSLRAANDRAEAAEARCREAAGMLRERFAPYAPTTAIDDILTILEARP